MRLVKTFIVAVLLWGSVAAQALENRYDLFAQTLAPITKVLAAGKQSVGRALSAEFSVVLSGPGKENVAGLLSAFLPGGSVQVQVFVQNPDKLLVRIPLGTTTLTLCRNGQEIWATPKELVESWAATTGLDLNASPKKQAPLGPLRLPFQDAQLVFLPALFQINDLGEEKGMRLLEVALIPEVARGQAQQPVRLWISSDHKPARLQFQSGSWKADLNIQKLESPEALVPEIWQAPAEALRLSPTQFRHILSLE